jgi:peptide/nickel transport system ATP-binding protein
MLAPSRDLDADRRDGEVAMRSDAREGPLLSVRDLHVSFTKGGHTVQAVSGVSLDLFAGETLGLVGESGCGKSTTGRAIAQIIRPTSGSITLGGVELSTLRAARLRRERTRLQMIFQDPVSSLNPRRRISDIVAEPLDIWGTATGSERERIVAEMLEAVGMDPGLTGQRYPRQFSGGQCQRISIARALCMRPEVLVCDEIVSALDVSIQAQILNLIEDLKRDYSLTLLFIAHDLAVVRNVSDRVAVMYLGRLCEVAPSDALYAAPAHPYTSALLASAVEPDPDAPRRHAPLQGEPPSPLDPPSGCRFRTRCPLATDRCALEVPPLREVAPGREVACHFPLIGASAPQSAA